LKLFFLSNLPFPFRTVSGLELPTFAKAPFFPRFFFSLAQPNLYTSLEFLLPQGYFIFPFRSCFLDLALSSFPFPVPVRVPGRISARGVDVPFPHFLQTWEGTFCPFLPDSSRQPFSFPRPLVASYLLIFSPITFFDSVLLFFFLRFYSPRT